TVTGQTTPWLYAFPLPEQLAGRRFTMRARGRTADEGRGLPTAVVISTVDVTAPGLTVDNPPGGTIRKAQNAVTITANDAGIGTVEMRYLVMRVPTDDPAQGYSWTGSSWSTIAGAEIWLSTDDAGGGTPDLVFPAAPGNVTRSLTSATTLKLPAWADGEKYMVRGYAADAIGNNRQTTADHRFIYDISRPTAALTAPQYTSDVNTSTTPWLRRSQANSIGGTYEDNVIDDLNFGSGGLAVFVRVQEVGGNYLDPALLTLTATDPDTAWKKIEPAPGGLWSLDTSGVAWITGKTYRVEYYARDRAKNWHGGDGGSPSGTDDSIDNAPDAAPIATRFFKYDAEPPLIALTYPENGDYGGAFLGYIEGTAKDGEEASARAGISTVTYYLRYDGETGTNHWDPDDYNDSNGGAPEWETQINGIENIGWSTDTYRVNLATWTIGGITWPNEPLIGQRFYFAARALDYAGNVSVASTTVVFRIDKASPTTSVSFPAADNDTFSQSLAQFSGVTADAPTGGDPVGVEAVRVGVKRLSDGCWWVNASTWTTPPCNDGQRDDKLLVPSGGAWTMTGSNLPVDFWNWLPDKEAETFQVYSWAYDKINKPADEYQYKNKESSTSYRVFHYDKIAPTSTVNVPISGLWYSSAPGYDLAQILGTATDRPASGPGSGNTVAWMYAEIRDNQDTADRCWGGSAFDKTCYQDGSLLKCGADNSSWRPMSESGGSWRLDVQAGGRQLWDAMMSGRDYQIRLCANDRARDASGSETFNSRNKEDSFGPQNERTIWVDKGLPLAYIVTPGHGEEVSSLDEVAGTARDPVPGAGLDPSTSTLRVAFYEESHGICIGANAFWNIATGDFDVAGADMNAPPAGAWGPVNGGSFADGINWTVSGSSVPAPAKLQVGCRYHVYLRVADKVALYNVFPAAPAALTQHIYFTMKEPTPETDFTAPAAGQHFKPTDLNQLTGTAEGLAGGATVQVRIINLTASPDRVWTGYGSNWASTSTYLTGACAPSALGYNYDVNYVVGESTCGWT
ncbi:MAG TPA: hypothetical protein PKK31_08465, partial [Elusimicrobiales bacterium]|nr:hypothetical protein [Elusimicrobiales bacterium]